MTKTRLYTIFGLLSLAGYAWLAWSALGHSADATVCLFKEATGIPCPSCGATRALILFSGGHLWQALLVNPLGFVLAAGLVIIPVWITLDIMRRCESFYRIYMHAEQFLIRRKWLSAAVAFVLLLNWAWNISKGL